MAVLNDWNLYDETPCSWNGVVCMGFPEAAAFNWSPPANGVGGRHNVEVAMASRVISLVLPNSQLLGSGPAELGLVEHLRYLDLSCNMLNGTLPPALFDASELRVLSLANKHHLRRAPRLRRAHQQQQPPAFPKNPDGTTPDTAGQSTAGRGSLRPLAVILITVGDLVGIAILSALFLYVYHVKKRKRQKQQEELQQNDGGRNWLKKERQPPPPASTAAADASECNVIKSLSCCLRKKSDDGGDTEEISELSESQATEAEEEDAASKSAKEGEDGKSNYLQQKEQHAKATLVIVDGATILEMETLFKASAYILGASASSIVYKAVLADGTALAVRRIGESSLLVNKYKEFDAQVRSIAKFRHPNLLRLRGFYWGSDEKLLIHDYAANGSFASITFSSTPLFLFPLSMKRNQNSKNVSVCTNAKLQRSSVRRRYI